MSRPHIDGRLDPAGLLREVATRLTAVEQRLTGSRRTIVETLAMADRPMSIPEILSVNDSLAQSSVYRNLSVMESAGIVTRVVTTDEWARYELSEALAGHHHHMVCVRCGAVADVHVPDSLEHEIDRVLGSLAKKAGFTLDHHRLDAVGVCRPCQENQS